MITHERGGATLVGGVAGLVLVADLLYAASRWSGSFPRSFLVALGGLVVYGIAGWLLGLGRPIGADRGAARRRQRGTNVVLVALLAGIVAAALRLGGNRVAEGLGVLAGLAAGFAAAALASLLARGAGT